MPNNVWVPSIRTSTKRKPFNVNFLRNHSSNRSPRIFELKAIGTPIPAMKNDREVEKCRPDTVKYLMACITTLLPPAFPIGRGSHVLQDPAFFFHPYPSNQPASRCRSSYEECCTQLREFSSTASFNSILEIFDETNALQKQLKLNDEELAKVKEEMKEKENKKYVAIDEMFEANKKEKIKRDEILKSERHTCAQGYQCFGAKSKGEGEVETGTVCEEKKVNELEAENISLKESVQVKQAHLDKLERLTAGYHKEDEEFMLNEFSALWDYATAEIYTRLKEDLPNQALENLQAWRDFRKRSDQALRHRVPLPRSNSKAAKQMRLVVILAILAREIDTNVFQPIYILPEDSRIRKVLAKLAANDNEKESFCRSILLSIDPDSQAKFRDSRIQTVIRNTSSCLFDLLPETEYDELRLVLERIVQKAVDIWKPIQKAKRRYEPDFDPLLWGDDEWAPFVFPDDSGVESQAINGVVDDNLLTVFPRISQVDSNGRSPCTFAVQFRRLLRPYLAAEQELIQEPPSPTIGRMSSARSRRKSITPGSPNQPKGTFLGKSVSPKA
ncbi:hypothetical protein ACJ73_04775 [Blastomyces percursus]|uniref:Uncharacterized protein n=1 Tax=Blastomyces percursus TaxID=1658174 RepID=A0A1J9Q5S3_9EURO|nr:hypothetical protein ACJ73_04775 [Blastomyces percursus]